MKFSDEQIRDILELRDHLSEKIKNYQDEIDLLEKNLSVLNLFIKDSSFTKASSLNIKSKEENSIPITRGADGEVIANAFVTPEQVSIVLKDEFGIDVETPPFKSFFMERIIGEMKRKDIKEVEDGKIQKESIIECVINQNGKMIREIIIKNYRQRERVDEIINTAGWSLSKMIENVQK